MTTALVGYSKYQTNTDSLSFYNCTDVTGLLLSNVCERDLSIVVRRPIKIDVTKRVL